MFSFASGQGDRTSALVLPAGNVTESQGYISLHIFFAFFREAAGECLHTANRM